MTGCEGQVGFSYTTDESKITELAGITLREYYNDLKTMIASQKRANQIIAQELGIERQGFVLSRGHVNGTEFLGCELFWPEDDEPMVARPALKNPQEIEGWQPPDPPDNRVAQCELRRAKEFYELTGQKTSVSFEGPVSVAAFCLGMESFYLLSATDPGLCELLVHKVTEACIDWKRYHDTEMGIGHYDEAGAADDSASFLSPPLFARLSLPYLQR